MAKRVGYTQRFGPRATDAGTVQFPSCFELWRQNRLANGSCALHGWLLESLCRMRSIQRAARPVASRPETSYVCCARLPRGVRRLPNFDGPQ